MKELWEGFKKFIFRGNVVDLAIGVLIGAAFSSVVTAFTRDLLTPLISAVFSHSDFSQWSFTVHHSVFAIGDLLNAIISFLITAAVIYFLVVTPINKLMSKFSSEPPADPNIVKCPECLSDIPKAAKRCKFCTAVLNK